MGSATEKEKGALMWGSYSGGDIFSIYFRGPAKDLLPFLAEFEDSIGRPYFGWNGELWDEDDEPFWVPSDDIEVLEDIEVEN